jgi:hypothetical protein
VQTLEFLAPLQRFPSAGMARTIAPAAPLERRTKDRGYDHDDSTSAITYSRVAMAQPRQITLEIYTSDPPIQGRLLSTPDLVRTFTGWTRLLAALDAAITSEPTHSRGEAREPLQAMVGAAPRAASESLTADE